MVQIFIYITCILAVLPKVNMSFSFVRSSAPFVPTSAAAYSEPSVQHLSFALPVVICIVHIYPDVASSCL